MCPQDHRGQSALHLAAEFGRLEALAWLLDLGTDPNILNDFSETPLHRAAEWNRAACVTALINCGANATQKNHTQGQPIHASGSLEVIRLLAELGGADLNAVGGAGEWPLQLLSVISLANDFVKRGIKGDPELEEETVAIGQAVQQGRQVVEGMLGYSRSHDAAERQVFNLCDLVEDSVGLLGQQFLAGIRLTLELDRTASSLFAPGARSNKSC